MTLVETAVVESSTEAIALLVAEDDPFIVRMLARTFKRIAPAMRSAPDAPTAIATLEVERFDVVWTDLDLGEGGDGIDVLDKAVATQPDALLLLVTGNLDLVARRSPPLGTRVFVKTDVGAAVECVRAHAARIATRA